MGAVTGLYGACGLSYRFMRAGGCKRLYGALWGLCDGLRAARAAHGFTGAVGRLCVIMA